MFKIAYMTIEELYQCYQEQPIVSTDTRQIVPGSLFFALKGERFNANAFAAQALENGARKAVVDEAAYAVDDRYILVDDTLACLQELARYHRQQLQIPVVGITGTNGKTTTKELLYAVLSQQFKTYATRGNLNNHIGVPLTLLAIDSSIEMAIVEMGANHLEEIAFLCTIAQPSCGLITNVGKAHLEGFGSFEGVKKTKGELYDYLKAHDGQLFLQGDNTHLQAMEQARGINRIVRYGFSDTNDVQGHLEQADPFLAVSWKTRDALAFQTVQTQLTGAYNTENILAAVAVGQFFGVSDTQINQGLAAYKPANNRSQVTITQHNTLIADYYNANVSSMEAALANMEVLAAQQKVIILGDMFELGADSPAEHKRVMERALALGADTVIFVGEAFYALKNDRAYFYRTTQEAKEKLIEKPVIGSTVLLKASRGMAFEQLIAVL